MTPVVEAATATCSHRHDDRASARASRRTWTATTSTVRLLELPDEPLPLEGPSSRSSVTEAGQAHPSHGLSVLCCARAWRRASTAAVRHHATRSSNDARRVTTAERNGLLEVRRKRSMGSFGASSFVLLA